MDKPLAHLIHTNVGGAGYETIESPDGWSRQYIDQVVAWLRSLKPASRTSAGYASGRFRLGSQLWSAVAVIDARFGTDQHIRQGVFAHALLVPVAEEDGYGTHQVALLRAAGGIGQQAEQLRGASESQLHSYRRSCQRWREVRLEGADLGSLQHAVTDTLPWLLRAVDHAAEEPAVLPPNLKSGLSLPQRLAHAVAALPPRLGLEMTWGCWVRPHRDLRVVVDRLDDVPVPSLPPAMVEYLNWLNARLRAGQTDTAPLAAVLSDWQINDWQALGRVASSSGSTAHPSSSSVPGGVESTPLVSQSERGDMHQPVNKQPPVITPAELASRARSQPPDAAFFEAQLDAMRRELDRSIARRFELLEKSLGVPVGSSGATKASSPTGLWLRRAALPALLALLALAVGYFAGQRGRPVETEAVAAASTGAESGATDPAADPAGNAPDPGDASTGGETGATESGATEPDAGQGNEAPAVASGGSAPVSAGASSSSLVFQNGWLQTWKTFAAEDKPALARWLQKIVDLEGIDGSQISQGQTNRLVGFVESLQKGQGLSTSNRNLARQALFEYVVARWVGEHQRQEKISINLGFSDVTAQLVDDLLADLDPKPRPTGRQASGPELQAAVISTWVRRQEAR